METVSLEMLDGRGAPTPTSLKPLLSLSISNSNDDKNDFCLLKWSKARAWKQAKGWRADAWTNSWLYSSQVTY